MSVVDVILHSSILTNRSHAYAMSAVAIDVFDENVGSVGLGAEAIIANIYPGVADCETIDVVRVPSISVLWKVLQMSI